jgi:hypothetical protein
MSLHHLIGKSAVVVLVTLGACSDGTSADQGFTVETLPNGTRLVRNTSAGAWALERAEPWRVEEDLRIGQLQGEPQYTFASIGLVQPTADGSIWVFETSVPELRLFDRDGRFVRAVGRRGQGPGEFSQGACAFAGPNGEIWVEDLFRRWQRFDSAGALLGEVSATITIGLRNSSVDR